MLKYISSQQHDTRNVSMYSVVYSQFVRMYIYFISDITHSFEDGGTTTQCTASSESKNLFSLTFFVLVSIVLRLTLGGKQHKIRIERSWEIKIVVNRQQQN